MFTLYGTQIRDFLDELKQGKGGIMERDHMLILGFSPKALSLISEICDALESEGGGTIVMMDDLDRQFMEEQLKVLIIFHDSFPSDPLSHFNNLLTSSAVSDGDNTPRLQGGRSAGFAHGSIGSYASVCTDGIMHSR
jgi:hypothetical protein